MCTRALGAVCTGARRWARYSQTAGTRALQPLLSAQKQAAGPVATRSHALVLYMCFAGCPAQLSPQGEEQVVVAHSVTIQASSCCDRAHRSAAYCRHMLTRFFVHSRAPSSYRTGCTGYEELCRYATQHTSRSHQRLARTNAQEYTSEALGATSAEQPAEAQLVPP